MPKINTVEWWVFVVLVLTAISIGMIVFLVVLTNRANERLLELENTKKPEVKINEKTQVKESMIRIETVSKMKLDQKETKETVASKPDKEVSDEKPIHEVKSVNYNLDDTPHITAQQPSLVQQLLPRDIQLDELPWWTYMMMAACAFMTCLVLNYVVNKVNETRLEDRYAQIFAKHPGNRGMQVREVNMQMESPNTTRRDPPYKQPNDITHVLSKDEGNRKINRKQEPHKPPEERVVKPKESPIALAKIGGCFESKNEVNICKPVQLSSSTDAQKVLEQEKHQEDQIPKSADVQSDVDVKEIKGSTSMPTTGRPDNQNHNLRVCVSDATLSSRNDNIVKKPEDVV